MNYGKIYNDLIKSRKNRILDDKCYYEKHHIIPKCLGGKNDKSNIVLLTAREHLLAHLLLTKIYPNNPKILFSVVAMTSFKNEGNRTKDEKYNRILSTRSFSKIRTKALSMSRKGENNPMYGRKHSDESKLKMSRKGELSPNYGTHWSEERKKNYSKNHSGINAPNYGKKFSEKHRNNISKSRKGKYEGDKNPFFGKTHSEETKQKIRETRKKHCKKVINPDNEILSVMETAKKIQR